MDNLLFYVFLAAVGGLIWLHLNRHNTDKLNALRAKSKNVTWIKMVEIALLLCAGAMGSFFAYQLLSPISTLLALVAAVLVVFFNLAEGIILRLTVNCFRHGKNIIGIIGVLTVAMIMLYSLTAGSSVIETFLNKHDDIKKYYQYEELASKQRIANANAGVLEAELKARELDRYGYLNNPEVAKAQGNAALLQANEYSKMAQLMKDKAPDLKIAFGFDYESISFLMALVLELSIVGVVIYQVLYIANDALLSAVRYENKTIGWSVNANHTANLSLEQSPAPDVVALPYAMPQVSFGGVIPHVPNLPHVPDAQGSKGGTSGTTLRTDTLGTGDTSLAPQANQSLAFNEWLEALEHGEIEPTTPPTKQFISERKLAKGIQLISAMANDWLERAFNLGVLELRQPQKAGLSKYVLKATPAITTFSLRKGEGV